jgi:hypothetical protein
MAVRDSMPLGENVPIMEIGTDSIFEERWKCLLCDYSFPDEQYGIHHMRRMHADPSTSRSF